MLQRPQLVSKASSLNTTPCTGGTKQAGQVLSVPFLSTHGMVPLAFTKSHTYNCASFYLRAGAMATKENHFKGKKKIPFPFVLITSSLKPVLVLYGSRNTLPYTAWLKNLLSEFGRRDVRNQGGRRTVRLRLGAQRFSGSRPLFMPASPISAAPLRGRLPCVSPASRGVF